MTADNTANEGREQRAITYSRVVSLSHSLHPGIPRWPGDPPVEFQDVASIAEDGFFMRRFSLGEHGATHLNAPATFYPDGVGIDAYPAESLVASAVVIDASEEAQANPDYLLTMTRLLAWEREHGPVPAGSVVLLLTGWQDKWNNPAAYLGKDAAGKLHFPGFGVQAAGVLLTQRGVAGVGIDTHGVDGGQDEAFSINRRVLERPRLVLENLTNLEQLPPTGATLVIGALGLAGGSGSPVSALAFVP